MSVFPKCTFQLRLARGTPAYGPRGRGPANRGAHFGCSARRLCWDRCRHHVSRRRARYRLPTTRHPRCASRVAALAAGAQRLLSTLYQPEGWRRDRQRRARDLPSPSRTTSDSRCALRRSARCTPSRRRPRPHGDTPSLSSTTRSCSRNTEAASSPGHFCEHAWGDLGTLECETL